MNYKNILLALELIPESDKLIISKAKELIPHNNGKLFLIHSIEHVVNFGVPYGITSGLDVEEEMIYGAHKALTEIGKTLHVPVDRQIVKVGSAKHLIVDEAKKLHINLIIIGSHGRHGVRLLLGSTANAVLHAVGCDVLAVRVR